jgi:hypothetical protein
MELIVEDREGRALGQRDLEGSRWELVGNHFENVQDIAVAITIAGHFGNMYIKNGNDRIGGDTNMPGRSLNPGHQIVIEAGKLSLNYHEQRTIVLSNNTGVPGSHIEFARHTAEELKARADVLQTTLARGGSIAAAAESLLASVYDLLVSLKISVT